MSARPWIALACALALSGFAAELPPVLAGAGDLFLRATPPVVPPGADKDLREQLIRQAGIRAVMDSWSAVAKQAITNADVQVANGVLADRARREVWLWCWGSGMEAGQPVEFYLIHEASGHGYETIAIAAARPSDLHQAMLFAGFKPGWNADPSRQRLWPKGDRVRFTVFHRPKPDADVVARPIEDFVALPSGGSLPPTNHVFTGSAMIPDPDDPSRSVYAANLYSPNAIAANFNLEATVFDLPRQARKEAVYGSQIGAKDPALAEGQPVLVRIDAHPDFPAGAVRQYALSVRAEDATLAFTLRDAAGTTLHQGKDLPAAVREVLRARAGAGDAHLSLDLDPALTTSQAWEVADLVSQIDTAGGVKVDPPEPGRLYYRAYTPRPEFRERRGRPFQPWELHLRRAAGGAWAGTLVILEEKWPEGKTEPDLVETSLPADQPGVLAAAMKEREYLPGVFFVFGPNDLPQSEAMRWVEPVQKAFPVVYIFGEK